MHAIKNWEHIDLLCKPCKNRPCHRPFCLPSHIRKYHQSVEAAPPIINQRKDRAEELGCIAYVDSDDVCHSSKSSHASPAFSKKGRPSNLLGLEEMVS